MTLPLLESLGEVPETGSAGGDARPRRHAFLFMPNGVRADQWSPVGEGSGFRFSPTLSPLGDLRSELLVLGGLMNAHSRGGDGHYAKTANWLTASPVTRTTGDDLDAGGVSVDQCLARHEEDSTRLPSLELGTEPVARGVDGNVHYTRLYASHIAWKTRHRPLPCEIDPQRVFDRLFRRPEAGARARRRASVLDLVLEDARALRGRLGRDDREKIDEYLESLRAVERRIERERRALDTEGNRDPDFARALAAVERRLGGEAGGVRGREARRDPGEHVRLMLDLMVLALWSDSTRVVTFMFGNAVSGRNFSFLDGVSGGHHEISHHRNDPETLRHYQRINQWHVEHYAYLLRRLRGVREGEGTLLDHSLVLFGSGLRDGNSHDPRNLPLVLAGRGGGAVSPGRHLVSPEGTPLSNLYLALLRAAGVRRERFADSTAPLSLRT